MRYTCHFDIDLQARLYANHAPRISFQISATIEFIILSAYSGFTLPSGDVFIFRPGLGQDASCLEDYFIQGDSDALVMEGKTPGGSQKKFPPESGGCVQGSL